MRSILVLFLLLLIVACQSPQEPVSMQEDVVYLASDSLMGREVGTAGELMAADYIASRFEQLGLQPKGSENYFQDFAFKPSLNPHEEVEAVDTLGDGMVSGRNVVGYRDNGAEYTVVIGAHYDHLGMGGEGSLHRGEPAIHNGADDNASGVALMMNLANRLQEVNTNSNYLFIGFSGEESGLLGSAFYVRNPTIDTKKVRYMINLDMVGRLKDSTVAVNGVGTSSTFKQTLFANNDMGLTISEFESGIGPSDFTSFYLADIPVLSFFTGQHEDYHKPEDDSDKINYAGMELLSDYIMNIITDLDDEGELAFRKTKNESEEVPAFKVGLGVVPDYLFTGEGMRIDGISEDKPAQKAGLQKGDVVKKLGELDVTDMMTYMKALSTFENGQTTVVTIERDGELIEVEVTF
ncbi:M28 family peptidase [Aureitalea marina]|uniref:Peptidase M28 n=1 Tax=Aureitalea marina TaxID=930804 RepID=A0A2S7KLN2_9FLAO|nr:M28 family peptidase [Aureitalea marina]PQB03508.1 peptidase M28 [Aureitalea marina]